MKRSGSAKLEDLLRRRKRLASELHKVEVMIADATPAQPLSTAKLEAFISAMSDGLPKLKPLPADFSRADIYDDHD